jgi:hypothetical protein
MACDFVKVNRDKVSTGIAIIGIIFILSLTYPNTQAQTNISFTPADKFGTPENNGSIGFAVNGTCSNVTFENNTWTFTNLCLTGSQPLENFEISTQNSNVTIFSYLTFNNTAFQGIQLGYAVEGKGKQVLNLGLGSEEEDWEWSVAFNGVFIGEGDGWNILRDGTLVVTGATGNVSIFDFESFGNSAPSSNLPFYQQHSVAIIITVAVAATVVVAVVIKVNSRKHSGESS